MVAGVLLHQQNLSARCFCVGWQGRGYRGWRLHSPLRESDGENLTALDSSGKLMIKVCYFMP